MRDTGTLQLIEHDRDLLGRAMGLVADFVELAD
jgi:hypothetical protein